MQDIYRLIMDPQRNPLRHAPPAQRFQVMLALSIMWTTIFTASIGIWYVYGGLLVAHVLAVTGVAITAHVFSQSARQPATYRDFPREDGSARYDDVWGG